MDPWGMEFEKIKLSEVYFTAEALDLLSFENAKKLCAIPIQKNGTDVKVAISDSLDINAIDVIRMLLSEYIVSFVIADKADLIEFIDKYYNPITSEYDRLIKEMERDGSASV